MALRRSEAAIAPRDVEDLLAAIYALDRDEAAHLSALREVWSRPSLGGPLAVAIARRACPARVGVIEAFDTAAAHLPPMMRQLDALISREANLWMLRSAPRYGSAARELGRTRAMGRSRALGVPDFLGILAPTHTGFAVVVGTPQLAPPSPRAARSHTLDALAEHLAAAWRLRKRLAAPDAFGENEAAILRPDGRVSAAFGPAQAPGARSRLRELVLARERALRAGDGALWPALLDGRYTIVDRFERGGARYVVAYRNSRTAASLARLSPLERRIAVATAAGTMTKVLALELGLSPARISSVLGAALRKLGLASAIELTLLASSSACVTLDDEILGPSIVRAFELRGGAADAVLALTPAERAVAADLLRGLGNREIAARRNRSERTVANQVASILAKAQAPTRRALVAKLNGTA